MRQDELGERFADLRKDVGLSQAALAKKLGISHIYIAYYETGERPLTLRALEAYHNYFDVSYDYLMGESINKNPDNIQIGKTLGLSDKSIETLKYIPVDMQFKQGYNFGEKHIYYIVLNSLFENEHFRTLILSLGLLITQCQLSDPYFDSKSANSYLDTDQYKLMEEQLAKKFGYNYDILMGEDLLRFFKHNVQEDFNILIDDIIKFEKSNTRQNF